MNENAYFKIGLVFGTIISIKLFLIGLALLFLMGVYIPVLELVSNLLAMIFLIIGFVGHLKTSYVLLFVFKDKSKEKNEIMHGIVYRLKQDIYYASKVLWFDIRN